MPWPAAEMCGKAINAVELLCQAAVPAEGALHLTGEDAAQLAPAQRPMRYDRDGDALRHPLGLAEIHPGQ